MYKVTPNGNYNVVINDLNLTIQATSTNGVLLSDVQVEGSSDVTRLKEAGYLLIEKVGEEKAESKTSAVETTTNAIFVAESERLEGNPSGVFVATGANTDVTVPQIDAEDQSKATILDEVEVKEVAQEATDADVVEAEVKADAPKATKASKPKEAKAAPKAKASTKKSNK